MYVHLSWRLDVVRRLLSHFQLYWRLHLLFCLENHFCNLSSRHFFKVSHCTQLTEPLLGVHPCTLTPWSCLCLRSQCAEEPRYMRVLLARRSVRNWVSVSCVGPTIRSGSAALLMAGWLGGGPPRSLWQRHLWELTTFFCNLLRGIRQTQRGK